jgi:threonine/homoserine/homoserine lactone efflux protein
VSSILFDLGFGLVLGFSLTIPPGPMNAFIASQSVRSFREGVTAGLGAMSSDLALGLLIFTLHSEVDLVAALRWIYIVGAAVMVYLALGILRGGSGRVAPATSGAHTYTKAFGLGISNPFQVAWWLTAGLAFAYLGGAVLFVALFGAIAAWIVAFPWAVHFGTERRPELARAVPIVSAALIFGFAGYFLYLAL